MTLVPKLFALAIVIGLAISQPCYAAITIIDDFNDGSFDTSKWNATLPFAESSFSESDGKLTLNNRVIISTQAQITSPITISGSLMASRYDTVRILTRSDLQVVDAYYNEIAGLRFSFHYDSNSIQIQDSNGNTVGDQPYNFNTGQWYDFMITDDGTNVSWSINGVSQLSGISNYSGGDYVAFHNREVNRGWAIPSSSSFDSISILGAPEPTRAILLLTGILSISLRRTRRLATHLPQKRNPLP
jgi:hypothetical protein